MKNTKAETRVEARMYNSIMVKRYMSLEDKLELLYDDLIDYVRGDLGAEKYEAIKKVVNTFKSWEKDENIRIILRELERIKNGEIGGMFLNAFPIEYLKEAAEVVLNDDDMEALLDIITAELWYIYNKRDIDENPAEVVEAVLNGNYHFYYKKQLTDIIFRAVAEKYYNYFYQDLDKSLSKIIDNYSKNGESLEPRVKEFIAKKEAEA